MKQLSNKYKQPVVQQIVGKNYVDDSKDILKGILAEDTEESDEEIEAKEVVEQDNTVVIM